MATDTDRLSDLEHRVAALERALDHTQGAAPQGGRGDLPDAETFWVLHGLRERVSSPGAVLMAGDVELPTGVVAQWQEGIGVDDLLEVDWSAAAESLAALGHPVRARLVREVLRGTTTARELVALEEIGTSGQVYHHLRLLVGAGWLRARSGTYEVPAERVVPLLAAVLGGRR